MANLDPLSFVIGVLVGWIIEWLIDYFYWRRRSAAQAEAQALTTRNAEIDVLNVNLAASQAEVDGLRSDLSSAQEEIASLQAALAVSAATTRGDQQDDLTMIEGIGPKIDKLLIQAGIYTFDVLGSTDVDRLREILEAGGPEFNIADPTTWPRQARLAAKGDWVGLQALNEELTGGVRRPDVQEHDDLTLIEGIGVEIDALLTGQGIRTFARLALTDPEELLAILRGGGPEFNTADPETWPEQARLAARGEWVKLSTLQQQLDGGREEDA